MKDVHNPNQQDQILGPSSSLAIGGIALARAWDAIEVRALSMTIAQTSASWQTIRKIIYEH
jgi:hypothetical protein